MLAQLAEAVLDDDLLRGESSLVDPHLAGIDAQLVVIEDVPYRGNFGSLHRCCHQQDGGLDGRQGEGTHLEGLLRICNR